MLGFLTLALLPGTIHAATDTQNKLKAVLLTTTQARPDRLSDLRREGYNAAALNLIDGNSQPDQEAAQRILKSGLDLYYWAATRLSNDAAANFSLTKIDQGWEPRILNLKASALKTRS